MAEQNTSVATNAAKNDKRTHRIVAIVVVVLAVLVLVVGGAQSCVQGDAAVTEGLPAWADQGQVESWTEQVVSDFNDRDYEAIASRFADGSISADQLRENLSATQDEFGAFEGLGTVQYLNGTSNGRPYATAMQEASYENGEAQFRISFFEDGSLAGFYFLRG